MGLTIRGRAWLAEAGLNVWLGWGFGGFIPACGATLGADMPAFLRCFGNVLAVPADCDIRLVSIGLAVGAAEYRLF